MLGKLSSFPYPCIHVVVTMEVLTIVDAHVTDMNFPHGLNLTLENHQYIGKQWMDSLQLQYVYISKQWTHIFTLCLWMPFNLGSKFFSSFFLFFFFFKWQGERLKLFYNPAANSMVPNEDFGIAFNGEFLFFMDFLLVLRISNSLLNASSKHIQQVLSFFLFVFEIFFILLHTLKLGLLISTKMLNSWASNSGGFNQPIMCGAEPRVMLQKIRGKADPPIYTIQIGIPKHGEF